MSGFVINLRSSPAFVRKPVPFRYAEQSSNFRGGAYQHSILRLRGLCRSARCAWVRDDLPMCWRKLSEASQMYITYVFDLH